MNFDPKTFREYVRDRHREGCGSLSMNMATAWALCDYLDGLASVPAPRVEVPDPARLAAATRVALARHTALIGDESGAGTLARAHAKDALETAVKAESDYWGGL